MNESNKETNIVSREPLLEMLKSNLAQLDRYDKMDQVIFDLNSNMFHKKMQLQKSVFDLIFSLGGDKLNLQKPDELKGLTIDQLRQLFNEGKEEVDRI